MSTLIFAFFILINSSFAQSSECGETVFLPNKYFRVTGESVKTFNQGNTGICYAYAGIEMVDYFWKTSGARFQGLPPQTLPELSPLYAAYLAKKNKLFSKLIGKLSPLDGTPLDAGDPTDVVSAIREKGMCKKEVIEESFREYAKSLGMKDEYDANFISDFLHYWFSSYYESKKGLKWYETWNSAKSAEFKKNYISDICKGKPKKFCDDFSLFLNKILPAFEKGKYLAIYDEMFKLCQNPENIYRANLVIPPIENKFNFTHRDGEGIKKRVIQLLSRPNATPLIISYCANVLSDSSVRGKPCHRHVSVLMGKRQKAGKCQFFLKNTWGENCEGIDPKYNCERQNNPNKYGEKFTFGLWIDADDLSNNIYMLSNFK